MFEAVNSVYKNYNHFVDAFNALCNPGENLDTKSGTQILLPTVCNLSFLCYLYFWADILKEVDQTQQYLQYKGLTLDRVVAKLEALRLLLHERRDFFVDSTIQCSIVKAKEYDIRCREASLV